MEKPAIRIENLSKKYVISHQQDQQTYKTVQDLIPQGMKLLERSFGLSNHRGLTGLDHYKPSKEDFWALKEISLDISSGERIGVIGRNGAGKSTLLKILSRITEPTSGRIHIRGRIASLLEVGTGFHPELTGRENIFLNGAILGMGKAEIKKKFDEIVAFAEVEKFLDTPVKRYSSGMYVRLAFSVAAHLEPEILIVDEVLAVGDIQFQKKCLGKMENVAIQQERTIIFVSHDVAAIRSLCTSAVLLEEGRIVGVGDVESQINRYLSFYNKKSEFSPDNPLKLTPDLYLNQFSINPTLAHSKEKVEIELEFYADQSILITDLCVLIYSSQDARVSILDLRDYHFEHRIEESSVYRINIEISSVCLVDGEYSLGIWFRSNQATKELKKLATLTILPGDSKITPYNSAYRGFVELDFSFSARHLLGS